VAIVFGRLHAGGCGLRNGDPGEINWPGLIPQPSRQGVYTVAFFMFWSITMACCSLVLWLAKPELEVNDEALSD